MPMADFTFYTDTYLGSEIPARAFPALAKRAGEALDRLRRIYRVTASGEDSVNMAICAMAETLYAHAQRRGGITGATVGQVSVRYQGAEQADRQLRRELYEKAGIYLDISRGVGP